VSCCLKAQYFFYFFYFLFFWLCLPFRNAYIPSWLTRSAFRLSFNMPGKIISTQWSQYRWCRLEGYSWWLGWSWCCNRKKPCFVNRASPSKSLEDSDVLIIFIYSHIHNP
jgi:hypothetical protein